MCQISNNPLKTYCIHNEGLSGLKVVSLVITKWSYVKVYFILAQTTLLQI